MPHQIFTWARLRIFTYLIISLSVLACTIGCGNGVHVETAFDQKAPFDKYKTFAMLLPNEAVPVASNVDPFKMLRVRQLTYGQLIARGFRAADKKNADFIVAVNGGTRQQVETYSRSAPYGYGYQTDARSYTEGTLVIEFIEPKTKTVVWHGRAKSRVTRKTSDERIADVIAALLAHFPPGSVQQ